MSDVGPRIPPHRRFLGLERADDDRTLLGLPSDGSTGLRSGQIEAALERRLDEIARHPLAQSGDARRLAADLEAAADRLQSGLDPAERGPLHPAAARRAARRRAAEQQEQAVRAQGAAAGASPSATGPLAPRVIRPTTGLTADDLTDFDRLALAVLVVSRGWNARSAKRLATFAAEHGISRSDLDRIVHGLTRFLSEGTGLRGALGEVGATARAAWRSPRAKAATSDAAEGAVERVLARIDSVIRAEVTSGTQDSQRRLAILFAAFALSWIGVLGWLFFAPARPRADEAPRPQTSAPVLADVGTPLPERGPVDANGAPIAPVAALAAPAKFPRPPGLVPPALPAPILAAASSAVAWIADLELAARDARAAGGRPPQAALDRAIEALRAASDAWPAAPAARPELLKATGDLARSLRGSSTIRDFLRAIPGGAQDRNDARLEPWQRFWRAAFGAGVLADLALDRTQAPEIAAAAREEMRLRAIDVPRGEVADPFGAAAGQVLAGAAAAIAESLALGTVTGNVDAGRWAQAVDAAASSPVLRTRLAIAAIDGCLRAPGALDEPGPLVDFLAFAIHRLDFSGRGADAGLVRDALGAWILNRAMPPSRIWVLTSLLDADLAIAWYGPDLVLPTDADLPTREALAERVLAAFPRIGATAVGEAVLVEKSRLEGWKGAVAQQAALPSSDAAARLRNAAAALAGARAARAFELGDERAAKEAEEAMLELMARTDGEWAATPSGQRPGLPVAGSADGEFARAWSAASRDPARRLELARELSSRPTSGDLGPADAMVAATEALRGRPAEVRAALATALVDRYSNGREVLRAVLDALADGAGSDVPATQDFVSRLAGTSVAGRDWIAQARLRLAERIFEIEDSREHAIDAAGDELARAATALGRQYGSGASSSAAPRPDRALAALADAMRAEASSRFLATPFPSEVEEIERLRAARRSLARSASQRMAAETPAIVDYAAMLAAARQPALASRLAGILASARAARAEADEATEQVDSDLRALLAILAEGLAPAATERSVD